jgi:hypothetical protein
MLDLLITHATLPDGRTGMSLGVQGGKFVEVSAGFLAEAHQSKGAQGQLQAQTPNGQNTKGQCNRIDVVMLLHYHAEY